ncbi:hypothetical protein [Schaalia sp. ZJ1691]|uniref:hypothetical protein n=1 Tax=Schaalia sp. ZJ1691 TaxID=2709404 RepID=UPI001F1534AB|nr:hypothetical protein [Schaalia sp. ZJ1691]
MASIILSISSMGIAVADDQIPSSGFAQTEQIQPVQLDRVPSFGGTGIPQALHSQHEVSTIVAATGSILDSGFADEALVEELFTKYISLDERNYMHVNVGEVRNSQYAPNITDLQNFTLLMNELNKENRGYGYRDGWSFAKCVIVDAVGVNMVARLTNGLYTAIRAAQWPLAAKTILQIAGSAGLSIGWKANAVGLAIALGKSAFYCRNKW